MGVLAPATAAPFGGEEGQGLISRRGEVVEGGWTATEQTPSLSAIF